MVKRLMDMCLGCIAQNLHAISNVGKHLPTSHKEKILQWVVDHNMLTAQYLPHVTYHLFSPALRSVSFIECDQITDKLLVQLGACKCVLESITIEGCKVTDVGVLALLSHQVELQTLVLKQIHDMTGTGLEVLRSRKLKEVDLSNCSNLTNKSLAALVTENPTISRLNLSFHMSSDYHKVTHEVIPTIASALANELEHLDLSSIRTVEDSDLVALSQHCKNLKGIVLNGCDSISSAGLKALCKECTKLQLLDVSFCYELHLNSSKDFLTELPVSLKNLALTDLQLDGGDIHAAVSRLPKLETLGLGLINSITEDHAVKIFQAVGPQLVCLSMSGCRRTMGDDMLRIIVKHCKALEEIYLAPCWKLTGEPLRMLFRDRERSDKLTLLRLSGCRNLHHDILLDMSKACVNLTKLHMSDIKSVDDTLLYSISANMPQLKDIHIKSYKGQAADQVTDSGVVELAKCCPLEDICLMGFHNITDKSVFALASNCPDLKRLNVRGCKKVTTQATNYLQDVCNGKVDVMMSRRTQFISDPNLLMAYLKNLDTGRGILPGGPDKWIMW